MPNLDGRHNRNKRYTVEIKGIPARYVATARKETNKIDKIWNIIVHKICILCRVPISFVSSTRGTGYNWFFPLFCSTVVKFFLSSLFRNWKPKVCDKKQICSLFFCAYFGWNNHCWVVDLLLDIKVLYFGHNLESSRRTNHRHFAQLSPGLNELFSSLRVLSAILSVSSVGLQFSTWRSQQDLVWLKACVEFLLRKVKCFS